VRRLFDGYLELLFGRPRLILVLLVLVAVVSTVLLLRLPVDTSIESLIIEDDPDLAFYNRYKEQFGEDEFLVVAFRNPEIFSPAYLRFIDRLTAAFEDIDEVREVVSLTNVEDIVGSRDDFYIHPLVAFLPVDREEAARIRRRALANPLIAGNLVSPDGQAGLFILRTRAHPGDEKYDARLIGKVRKLLADPRVNYRHEKFHLAGWLVTDVGMSSYMTWDLLLFLPLTTLLLIVLFWFFLRNWWAVCWSMVNITLCLLVAMALLYLDGGSVSPMTAILPPLMMALAASDSIHVFTDFFQHRRSPQTVLPVLRRAMRQLAAPCFLTSFTTAAGFFSLVVSKIPPIRQFGLAAAGGMLAEYCLTMMVIPLGILWTQRSPGWSAERSRHHGFLDRLLRQQAPMVVRGRWLICGLALLLTAGAVWQATRVKVETNVIEYFRAGSRIARDTAFVDRYLGGVNTLEVSFRARRPDAFKEPANLAVIGAVSDFLQQRPAVGKILSVNSFLMEMNRAFHGEDERFYRLPASREMTAQYLLLYDGDEIYNFIDRDYRWARLSARVSEHRSSRLKEYIDALQDFVRTRCRDAGLEIRATGKTFLVNKLIKNIVDSQVQSLLVAFLIIFAVLFMVFRSFTLGFISIVPNILPIIFNLGLMGLVGIPLNTATAIIAAVTIGIAVDDTIHYLHQYQRERAAGAGRRPAVVRAIARKGVPMTTTSLLLVGAFSILLWSNFIPTAQFGLLCAVTMVNALVCDLLVLPALLSLRR